MQLYFYIVCYENFKSVIIGNKQSIPLLSNCIYHRHILIRPLCRHLVIVIVNPPAPCKDMPLFNLLQPAVYFNANIRPLISQSAINTSKAKQYRGISRYHSLSGRQTLRFTWVLCHSYCI